MHAFRRTAVAAALLAAAFAVPPAASAQQPPAAAEEPTAPGEVPDLWRRIAQRDDPAGRQAALAEAMAMLQSDDAAQRERAMLALAETDAVPYDRAPFLPVVRRGLDDPHAGVRALALRMLKHFGGTAAADMPAVAARVQDPERHVRAWVAFALYQLDATGANPAIEPAIMALLADGEAMVVKETCRHLWGRPTSGGIEARLVELSRDPARRKDVVYFALSTRPLTSAAVVDRLVEVVDDHALTNYDRRRAAWGLTHHSIAKDALDRSFAAIARWLETDLDAEIRRDAAWGLALYVDHHDRAIPLLEKAASSDESEAVRKEAGLALQRLKAATQVSAAELVGRIQQIDDPLEREAALVEVGAKLQSNNATERERAMLALLETGASLYDRAPFLPMVRRSFADPDPDVRALALRLIARFGGTADADMPSVAACTKDPHASVRQWVAFALYELDATGTNPAIEPAVLALLADADPTVVKETCRYLWDRPTGCGAIDDRLIELSRDPVHGQDAIYFALSTRPLVGSPVAERLIEIVADSTAPLDARRRAAWGLTHHSVVKESWQRSHEATVRWLESDADAEIRREAAWGLSRYAMQRDLAIPLLEKVAASDENEAVRQEAARAAEQLKAVDPQAIESMRQRMATPEATPAP